jgi:hypothetical protein
LFTFFLRHCQALLRNALTADTSRKNEARHGSNQGDQGTGAVIGGYRTGKNYFGNLALGYYDDAGTLILSQKFKMV